MFEDQTPFSPSYPSDGIIALALEKGIPFTTASDAHSYAQLKENYDRLPENAAARRSRSRTFQPNKPAGLGIARNLDPTNSPNTFSAARSPKDSNFFSIASVP